MQLHDDSMKLSGVRQMTEGRSHEEAPGTIATRDAELGASRDALYRTAINQRRLMRHAEALATLERLQQRFPRFSRLYEERGHCFLALNDVGRAIDAFERSIDINAALPASWSMLERLYRVTGDLKKALIAAEHAARLQRLPQGIVQAGSLFCDGDLQHAESVLRTYLLNSGTHVEALRLLGRIAHQRNALDDAERFLEEVLASAPTYQAARADYARVLIDLQEYPRARQQIADLLLLAPDNMDYLSLQASVWAGIGEHERAIHAYHELQKGAPDWAHLPLLRGHSLKAIGQRHGAVESYRAAAALRADFGDAYWSLANLKTYRFDALEIERMHAAESAVGTQLVDRYHLCFALGKAHEDWGDYPSSWSYYERGNALKSMQSPYVPRFTEANTRAQIEACHAGLFAAHTGVGASDSVPIFIVGLPRSGSTLIEQILASHSQVEGTRELPGVERIVRELQGRQPDADNPRYPAVLTELDAKTFRKLGNRYLSETRAYRKGRPFFIDKMPNNFRHIGLIRLMFPDAKIIDVRREPMACCFSNLKQLFASGQEFTYSIDGVAHYYRGYLELMRHWDAVLSGRVLHVRYEDVVEDIDASVRRLLLYCGLPFEAGCVEFYKSSRTVGTASSEQVRQPIFRTGLTHWRQYERWLGPLKYALGDALSSCRE